VASVDTASGALSQAAADLQVTLEDRAERARRLAERTARLTFTAVGAGSTMTSRFAGLRPFSRTVRTIWTTFSRLSRGTAFDFSVPSRLDKALRGVRRRGGGPGS